MDDIKLDWSFRLSLLTDLVRVRINIIVGTQFTSLNAHHLYSLNTPSSTGHAVSALVPDAYSWRFNVPQLYCGCTMGPQDNGLWHVKLLRHHWHHTAHQVCKRCVGYTQFLLLAAVYCSSVAIRSTQQEYSNYTEY